MDGRGAEGRFAKSNGVVYIRILMLIPQGFRRSRKKNDPQKEKLVEDEEDLVDLTKTDSYTVLCEAEDCD